jgi:hypothetical protein
MKRSNTDVLHTPRLIGNFILSCSDFAISLRRFVTSSKTSFSFFASYLFFLVIIDLSRARRRGLPKTCCPRDRYSWIHSGTLMRNLPSIIAMSLRDFLVSGSKKHHKFDRGLGQSLCLTLPCLNRRCSRNNDMVDTV